MVGTGSGYAGFWVRLCATTIDVAGLWLLELAVVYVVSTAGLLPFTPDEGFGLFLVVVFWLIPAWPYFAMMESSKAQATFGKQLFGLRVTDDIDGDRLGFYTASARYFAKVVSYLTLGLGFILIAFSDRKQGLHDKIAGTLVVWGRSVNVHSRP